jgi:hypothetical protein
MKNFETLDKYLSKIIETSVKSTLQRRALQEKEKQDSTSKKPIISKDDPEYAKLKKGEISAEDIVEKLNAIRSGKSFKDESISSKLSAYIDSLSKEEKTALLAFLKGISQIVTGEISPDSAQDPSEDPSAISMKKTGGPQKVHIKPVVIKTPKKDKEEKKEKSSSKEDTAGPVPIKPKK